MRSGRLARVRRYGVWLLALLALAVVGSVPLGPWLVRARPVASPAAILVLGSHEAERLPHAAHLAARWPDAEVWLTQPTVVTPYNCYRCAGRVAWLGELQVAAARVRVLAPTVRNTADELRAARASARARGIERVVVVTSPYHTRRVLGLLAAADWTVGVGVVPCPVPEGLAVPWWSRRYDRRYVVYELAAMAANSWRDGVAPRHWFGADGVRVGTL